MVVKTTVATLMIMFSFSFSLIPKLKKEINLRIFATILGLNSNFILEEHVLHHYNRLLQALLSS